METACLCANAECEAEAKNTSGYTECLTSKVVQEFEVEGESKSHLYKGAIVKN